MVTGVAALIGGVLLAVAPDGSLLSADVAALEGCLLYTSDAADE